MQYWNKVEKVTCNAKLNKKEIRPVRKDLSGRAFQNQTSEIIMYV